MESTSPVAALTVIEVTAGGIPAALWRMARDPVALRRERGLRFARLLGTARGHTFGPWEPRRWAMFTVWSSTADLDAFEQHSRVAARWRSAAREHWSLRLRPLSWHGAWGGQDPFSGIEVQRRAPAGPVVVLTRATIHLRRLRTFRASAADVERRMAEQPGLVASLGSGETPFWHQATFSLWQSTDALQRFAYGDGQHRAVIQRTRDERWYREELFARFEPLSSTGTWRGTDPLRSCLEPSRTSA